MISRFIFQVRTILDIGCGYGNLGAHLFSNQLLTMCIANYEASGSQVQLTLERGLPAMIGSFTSQQLPYPSLSFDMIHCAGCGVDWDQKGIVSFPQLFHPHPQRLLLRLFHPYLVLRFDSLLNISYHVMQMELF